MKSSCIHDSAIRAIADYTLLDKKKEDIGGGLGSRCHKRILPKRMKIPWKGRLAKSGYKYKPESD